MYQQNVYAWRSLSHSFKKVMIEVASFIACFKGYLAKGVIGQERRPAQTWK